MKKLILGLCLIGALLGTPVYATSLPLTQVEYVQILKELRIQLLIQMIADLQAQLNQMLAQESLQGVGTVIESPTIQLYQAPVLQPTKELIVTQEKKGDCILMETFVKDEDGLPFYGDNQYQVKVIANTFPNRVSIIGLMSDNNEYEYCNPEGEEKQEAIIKFTIDRLDLKKVLVVTP